LSFVVDTKISKTNLKNQMSKPKTSGQGRLQKRLLRTLKLGLIGLMLALSLMIKNQGLVESAPSTNLNFQARLLGNSGAIVPDGNYHVEFKLYNVGSGGSALWTETRTTGNLVSVKSGYLSVYLGSVTAFPGINWNEEHWLTMNIGGSGGSASWDGEMTPRIKLTAVPFAFQAEQLAKSSGSNRGTLGFNTVANDPVITLPDATGTVCLQTSSSCGFATGSGAAFVQGGNDFGANAVLGTNGAGQTLSFETANTTRLTLDTSGNATLTGDLTVQGTGTSSFAGNIQVDGNATLGNASGDTLTINGTAVSIPNNLNFDSNTLFIDASTNRVGIGNNAPSAALEVTGDIYLTKEAARTIKLANSTTAATAGAALSILGADGNGAAGGAITIQAGAATGSNFVGGDITVQAGAGVGFTVGGNIDIRAGGSLVGGQVRLNGGDGFGWQGDIILQNEDTNSQVGIGVSDSDAHLELGGNMGLAAWGLNGAQLQSSSAIFTDTSTAASGTVTNAVINSFGRPTLAATNTGITTTNAATVYIQNSPLAGTNQTITNAYALWVDDGTTRLDHSSTSITAGTERGTQVTMSDTGVVTTGTDTTYGQQISVTRTGATGGTINTFGLDIQATGDAGGTSTLTGLNVNVSGADTNYAALFQGGNVGIGDTTPDARLDVEPTGAVTTTSYAQRIENLQTNATTDAIDKYGLYISSTGTFTGSGGTATNNYGLYVATPTGGDNNYAAIFQGGNVGIGDTAPTAALSVGSGGLFQVTSTGTVNNAVTSATALRVQSGSAADTAFTVDTSNNRVKIGNDTGTGTSTTLLVVDSATSQPTAVNGAIFYNSSTNQMQCGENSAWSDCGSTNLQQAYNNDTSGDADILTADNKNVLISLADTTTDSDFVVDMLGTGNTFEIRDSGTAVFSVSDTGTTAQRVTTDSAAAFQLQNSSGATLFSLDSTNTGSGLNLAQNGGGEAGTTTPTSWAQVGSPTTFSRTTTSGQYASGSAGVLVTTTATSGQGVKNNLGAALSNSGSQIYNISFSIKAATATITNANLLVRYLRDGTTVDSTCSTMSSTYGTVSTTGFIKYTCTLTPSTTAGNSSAAISITQNDAVVRSLYIDNFSIVAKNSTGTQDNGVLRIGGASSQGLTILTLDTYADTPFTGSNAALAGSMYFDTTQGKIQCYDGTSWGACGAAPDNIITLTPEYSGAVLNGSGIGTMTADFCGNGGGLSVNTSFCASGEARNFYRWTSPQASYQTYSIYVTYKLPSTFKSFVNGTTTVTGRVDDTTNAGVTYQILKSTGSTITSCSATSTVVGWTGSAASGSANTWTAGSPTTDPSTCTFAANNYVIFQINVTGKSNANAYVENLQFRFSNQ
jgi:hypothetical protein